MAMSVIWTAMVGVSILCGLATGRMAEVAAGAVEGAGAAVERALADALALPSEGYLQYLAGLCRVAQARQAGQRLDAAQAEAVYGRFERALVEMEGGRRPEWENLRRCARSLRAETGAEIPEGFEHLRALLDD